MAPKTPKAAKTIDKSKSGKGKDSKNDSEDKRKRQANMITQLKASEEKKKKLMLVWLKFLKQRKKSWMLVCPSWPSIVGVTKENKNSRCWKPLRMTRPARLGKPPLPGK